MKLSNGARLRFFEWGRIGLQVCDTVELFEGTMPLVGENDLIGRKLAEISLQSDTSTIGWDPDADDPYVYLAFRQYEGSEENFGTRMISSPAFATGKAQFARVGSTILADAVGAQKIYFYCSVSSEPGEADMILNTTDIVKTERFEILSAGFYIPG